MSKLDFSTQWRTSGHDDPVSGVALKEAKSFFEFDPLALRNGNRTRVKRYRVSYQFHKVERTFDGHSSNFCSVNHIRLPLSNYTISLHDVAVAISPFPSSGKGAESARRDGSHAAGKVSLPISVRMIAEPLVGGLDDRWQVTVFGLPAEFLRDLPG